MLFVVLDCNLSSWLNNDFVPVVSQLLVFLNAHLSLDHDFKVLVFGVCGLECKVLYPTKTTNLFDQKSYKPFAEMNSSIINSLKSWSLNSDPCDVSKALSRILCCNILLT